MAISYEDWKTQYEGMTTEQQKNYANMVKGNATAEEYANRYIRESQSTNPTPAQSTPASTPATTPAQPVEQPTAQQPVVQQQQTPVSTVPEIKQEGALQPLSQEYYNQETQASLDKIRDNLDRYKQTNPEYFTDYESFKRNFSYNARNDAQKETLDQWYKTYTNNLQLGSQTVTDLYTQYKNGTVSTADLEALRTANPAKYAELQAQINKGSIVAAYDDDQPTSATMWEQLKNSWLQNMITNLNTAGSGASGIFDDYQAKMESPEMVGLGDEAAAKQEEIEKITADIDSIKKTVEAEYAGKGASRAKINAIISDRTYDLQLQLRSLNSEYNRIATQYNNRMTQYQNEFQLQLQEYQLGMQERDQRMQELGFAMDLMNFETNDQKAEREWNYWVKQQEYMNGDINSKDYSTRYKAAIKSVENLLSQYQGIPMQRSAEQMAEDILKNMDSKGTTLGQELSEINKMIQQKPEYKYLYNQTYVPTTQQGIQGTYKIGDQEYVLYNNQLLPADQFNSMFGGTSSGSMKPYDTVDSRALSMNLHGMEGYEGKTLGDFVVQAKNWEGKKGGQCGKFVNDYLESIGVGRYYDNELSTKLNSVNSSTPKVGTIAVFNYNKASSDGVNYGHVGIVTKVNGDGTIEVLDSNYKSDGIIHKRTVKLDSPSLKGFFDPSRGQEGLGIQSSTQGSVTLLGNTASKKADQQTLQYLNGKYGQTQGYDKEKGYIKSLTKDYETYLTDGKAAVSDKQWESLKEEYGLGEQDFRLMAQNYADTTLKQSGVEQASDALSSAIELYNMLEQSELLGMRKDNPQAGLYDKYVASRLGWTDAGEAKEQYNSLMSKLQLNQLFNAKNMGASFGSMSDSEWNILGSAATNLKRNSSPDRFKNNLTELIKTLNSTVVKGGGALPSNFTGSSAAKLIGGDTSWQSKYQTHTNGVANIGGYNFSSSWADA